MKNEKYLLREGSIITGKNNLEPLHTFENFPVFMGCVDQPINQDLFADMEWAVCPESGMIQLRRLLPLEVLYQNQHNDGTGKVWNDLYSEFADFLAVFQPQKILEIGGAHGKIAQNYLNQIPLAKWTLIEPHPVIEDKRIKIIEQWFDENFVLEEEVDTIIHSHSFEHTYDPVQFLKQVYGLLKPGQKHAFVIPNLYEFLKNKFTNALNFEHTFFLTEYFMDYLLETNGFKILKKRGFGQNHSIFYLTQKDAIKKQKFENKYQDYKSVFLGFVKFHDGMVKELNALIASARKEVFLFGAHIFSQFLIGFGLNTDKIVSVLDNSPMKQEKRLYGTRLKVHSPKILQGRGGVNVILKAGPYNQEIKGDILKNINPDVVFW